MNKPMVSVVTGFYNRSEFLDYTISSILSQTYENFELIVFNDFSQDNTSEELERIKKKYNDPRLIVIEHDENMGFTKGMISAINQSKGEYICVQGSGDFSYPRRLEFQVSALEKNKEVGLVGCFYENCITETGESRLRTKVADSVDFSDLRLGNYFSHGEVMYRRSVYDEVGGYRDKFVNCQDYDLWLRMVKVCRFHTVQQLLYRRHVRFDGVSYKPSSFLRQTRYFFLCQDLAALSVESQKALLDRLDSEPLEDIIPLQEARVQKRVVLATFRSMVFGGRDDAILLAKQGVQSRMIRFVVITLIRIYSHGLLSPVRKLINWSLGLRNSNDN